MEEKKRAVAKKLITPNMHEWLPVSPKMPEKPHVDAEEAADAEGLEPDTADSETVPAETLHSEVISSEVPDAKDFNSEDFDSEELISEEDTQAAVIEEPATEEVLADNVVEEEYVIEQPVEEEPHSRVALSDNKSGLGMGWYVVHTYSGYENKVKANIEKAIENRHLENEILEVRVPLQDVMELKNGVEKTTQKKMFPGYVLLHMDADNNDAWYVVRNTRGVTGFVGPGSKPVPLTEAELKALDFGVDTTVEFAEGDVISVTAGVWKDTVGTVQKIDATRQTVTINVEMFGRETPVEINFSDVKKMWD